MSKASRQARLGSQEPVLGNAIYTGIQKVWIRGAGESADQEPWEENVPRKGTASVRALSAMRIQGAQGPEQRLGCWERETERDGECRDVNRQEPDNAVP